MSEAVEGNKGNGCRRLPPWLRNGQCRGESSRKIGRLMGQLQLNTVCRSASCPNQQECWNSGTATFLILGPVCTRQCGFCNVRKGSPSAPDPEEPARVAVAVALMGLSYAVLTSVTRDDLEDGGAGAFAGTIRAIRSRSAGCRIEVLVPDFQGSEQALELVFAARPDVLNHNIETVPSQYARVRPQADYHRSLELILRAKQRGFTTKSGLMIGLGERPEEVRMVMEDLREAGCDILTIGQYLQPSKNALKVAEYHPPEEFVRLQKEGNALGFSRIMAGPLVRSSYHAERTSVLCSGGTAGNQ